MWIHVPSIPLACVRDMRASDLGFEKLSELESSAMWKSNFQQSKSWQNVWRKRPSMRLLSGLISEPSILSRGVEKWICSLEDSHASRSVLQGSENKKTTSETSGLMSPDLLGGLGFQSSFFSKTSVVSCDTTGTPYDPNFERWVTKLRRDSSQRQVLGLLTRGNDSSFWPTAQNKDYKRENLPAWEARQQRKAEEGINLQQNLCIATLKNWRTPAASDPEGGVEDWSSDHFQNTDAPKIKLRDQAANWMTPNTMDALAPKSQEALDYEHDTARQGRSNPNNLRDQASVQEGITNWPTPNTRDHHAQGAGMNPASRSVALSTLLQKHQAANWPTPASRDWKGFDPPGKQNTKSDPKMYLSIPQAPATAKDGFGSSTDGPSLPQPSAKNHRCSPKCRRLNANFAAHLMGLPKNYLLKSCCGQSAMESFQQWQHSLSEHLARL